MCACRRCCGVVVSLMQPAAVWRSAWPKLGPKAKLWRHTHWLLTGKVDDPIAEVRIIAWPNAASNRRCPRQGSIP